MIYIFIFLFIFLGADSDFQEKAGGDTLGFSNFKILFS